MSTESIIGWILGTAVVIIGAGVTAHIKLLLVISELKERIRVMEVLFETFGRKAAKALHSPHDPYGIDPLLDKYLDRHYELSIEEWSLLLKRCKEIEAQGDVSKEQKFFAGMLEAVCWHKLHIDPPMRKDLGNATK